MSTKNSSAGGANRATFLSVGVFVPIVISLGWSAIDASFPLTVWASRANLGLEKWFEVADPYADKLFGITSSVIASVRQWDHLGKRMCCMYVLAAMGILTWGLCCWRAFKKQGFVTVWILASLGWLTFFATRQHVDDWRDLRQSHAVLQRVEPLVESLQADWPTASGQVPGLGRCLMKPGENQLHVEESFSGDGYPVSLKPGLEIGRDRNGVLRFHLIPAYGSTIEFHPTGSTPFAYDSGFDHWQMKVESVSRLKDNWYLVRYSQKLVSGN